MTQREASSPHWRGMRVRGVAAVALGAAAVLGLWPRTAGHAQDAADVPGKQTPTMMDVKPATDPQVRKAPPGETLAEGRRYYNVYCVGCHGEKGDGKGPAALFLNPKPRDFTQGKFKFSSRPTGQLPTDEDLIRTINNGLAGSAMPGWAFMPEYAKRSIVTYIKTFAPERWEEGSDEAPIPITENPWEGASESRLKRARARGEEVYHGVATCWECHASYVSNEQILAYRAKAGIPAADIREGVEAPVMKKDDWGDPIWPTNFQTDRIKTGSDLTNLFRVIAAGIGGTAMPTWKQSLPDEDIWAMAYYVQSLAAQRNERVTAGAE